MACTNFEKFGILYYFRELSSMESERYHRHLENCSECKDLIGELQFLEDTYRSEITLQPQAEVVEEVLFKANKFVENKWKKRFGFVRNPRTSIRPLAFGALGLLIVMAGAFFWFKKEISNRQTSKEVLTWQDSLDDSFDSIQLKIDQIKYYPQKKLLPSEFELASDNVTLDNRLSEIKFAVESLILDLESKSF